jgi:hypothetical protein
MIRTFSHKRFDYVRIGIVSHHTVLSTRSEMNQMREMLSYQTGLITGLVNTVSTLQTSVTTLYEAGRV